MIGVSPAFCIATCGPGFTAAQLALCIKKAAGLGFDAVQLEIFRPEAIAEWTDSFIAGIQALLREENLAPTQFVSHFALADFSSPENLREWKCREAFRKALSIASEFSDCPVVTLPIPPFVTTRNHSLATITDARNRSMEILEEYSLLVAAAGKQLALEVMPGSIVGGMAGFTAMAQEIDRSLRASGEGQGRGQSDTDPSGFSGLRLNFDTGHAVACKENMQVAVALAGNRMVGTHLCDNFGHENLKLAPGAGSTDFVSLFRLMQDAGYSGSWDIEILCAPGLVESEYASARQQVARFLEMAGSGERKNV